MNMYLYKNIHYDHVSVKLCSSDAWNIPHSSTGEQPPYLLHRKEKYVNIPADLHKSIPLMQNSMACFHST